MPLLAGQAVQVNGQVRQQLRRLREIGVTDFVASRIVVEGDPDAYDRTYQLLADVARLGLS